MRLWALAFCCAFMLASSVQGFSQHSAEPAKVEGHLNADEHQEPADADAAPKPPAGTVTRPKDGVPHPDLDEAWADYDTAVTKVTESIQVVITKQFDAAAAKGDLNTAEKWQAIGDKFEKVGELPSETETKAAVNAAAADYRKAREELTKAYKAVVKSLTMEKKIAEARAVREESDAALSLSSDAKEPNGMTSLARKATMSGTAAERVKVGDIFTGTWTQTRDPASVWEVDLSVLEITGDAVKVRIDFPRQKLDTNGRVNNVGLVHLSEGSLANGEMKLECKNVNLPQFQDNVGWAFVVVVRNGQLIGSNFDLKLVPTGR